MNTEQEFYVCTFCFFASETNDQCHDRAMVHYPGYAVGDARLKPIMTESGRLKTRMPRWMLSKPQIMKNEAQFLGGLLK